MSYLLYPYISDHYLLFHINPNDLRKLHPHFNRQSIRAIANRTNESEKYYILRIEHMKYINVFENNVLHCLLEFDLTCYNLKVGHRIIA